jgi:XFP C-terminal domain
MSVMPMCAAERVEKVHARNASASPEANPSILVLNSGSSSLKFQLFKVDAGASVSILQRTVRGYKEEGATTTPFNMVVRNDLDRFHLVTDVLDRVHRPGSAAAYVMQLMRDKLLEHKRYIIEHGVDMPEITQSLWVETGA